MIVVQKNPTELQVMKKEHQIDLIVLHNLRERNFHNSVIKLDISQVGGYDARTGKYIGD
jgi:hypothetical protein